MTEAPIRVLFVCTGNSCRSIMAEALLREHGGTDFDVHSAGTDPKGLNPRTMRLLANAGIDASWARSKSVDEYLGQPFDYVITVCDQARQVCPVFPGSHESLHWGYEDPAEIQEAIDRAEAELFAVSQKRVDAGFSPLKSLLHDAYDRLDYLHAHRGEISGVRTGFTDLDTLTTGLQKSDLVVLAARPSVGKTSFALNIAEHAAVKERKSVGVFSLEMSKEQLVLRLLSSVANIDSQRLRSGFLEELDFARIAPAMNALSEAPMYIDDTPNISAMELRTKARRLQAEAGLDLVIVDYLQLMQATTTNRDANRVQEVSEISRGLKALARELSIPVIALSQLSRQPEMRESKEPRLSDLRESGAIEQDADLVVFLYREKEKVGEDADIDGEVINVKLAKHRNGPTGDIQLWFRKSQTRFQSYAGQRYAETA
jgi:replicative DNA helicase